MHQHVDVGDLARIYLLDERQYSDVPPCRDGDPDAEDFGDCAERAARTGRCSAPTRRRGSPRRAASSTATWNLIGNPVVLAGIDGGNDTDGAAYYLDTWDGYPTARHRFIEQLAAIDNPVVLTGDYHAGMLIDVHERPFEPDTAHRRHRAHGPADLVPPVPGRRHRRGPPSCATSSTATATSCVDVTPDRVHASFRVLDDVERSGQRHLDARSPARSTPAPPTATIDA